MSKTGLTEWGTTLRLKDLSASRTHKFKIEPAPEQLHALAEELGIDAVRKVRFTGELRPLGQQDWHLVGEIGATVTQPCVTTLQPVVTRIDDPVERKYLSDFKELDAELIEDGETEIEMPEDDTSEALPATLTLSEVAIEALVLALPDYPRAPDATLERTQFTETGKEALTDDDVKPFAGLKALRDKLEKGD
ncbi:YceD family protein [Celeribacter sp.]|uniref:YceD family protein n=1 Tax=Celeribacter sp. TaxID=1890673 RepID=UPI003A9123A3